ncbi:hypothetical protein [Nonomuraea sp. NPDC050783]
MMKRAMAAVAMVMAFGGFAAATAGVASASTDDSVRITHTPDNRDM